MQAPGQSTQYFGNLDASNGAFAFQGIVNGDIHFDRLPDAAFNAASKQHASLCLRGTRCKVLDQIKSWADGNEERPIYWLKGMAGTGKSTIALTIAREYYDCGRLAASFFFARGGGDLASVNRFAPTIASHLADLSPELRNYISDAVVSNPRVYSLGLNDQWKKLVLEPLSRLSRAAFPHPLVIVVDALDECEGEEEVSGLIQCLQAATLVKSVELRVFATSRPGQPINVGFNRISLLARQDFILHDIEQSIVNHDLELYYKHELADIAQWSGMDHHLLSDDTIEQLVERSNGLFIHAVTVCRTIRFGRQVVAGDRLLSLLTAGNPSVEPEKELDQMYTTILSYSFPEFLTAHLQPPEMTKLRQLFHRIVGSIVVLFDAMSMANLAVMVEETEEKIAAILSSLHSVIDVPQHRQIRLVHPSFRDFLLDPSRCSHATYSINAEEVHGDLFTRCLRILLGHLRRNMCGLSRPGTRARVVSKVNVDKCIPVPVQYACRYWIYHLRRSAIDPREHSDIMEFFETRYLFWLETLALMGRLPDGVTMILELEKMLAVTAKWMRGSAIRAPLRLHSMVYDAKRFLLSHSSIIEEAPLQVYCSALLFSPKNSIIKRLHSHETPTWVVKSPSVTENWSPYSQILSHPDWVTAVAFSFDGKVVATGCVDHIVRLWDAVTGTQRRTLKGHSSRITQVACSPEGTIVASSARDKTIRLWHTVTGTEQHVLPCDRYSQIAFSSDGGLIAFTLDKTIQIWNVAQGTQQHTLRGHTNRVNTVAFSPDGSLLASGAQDQSIRLWNVSTGAEQRRLKGHTDDVNAVVFSPDGSLLASASFERNIRLWNVATGSEKRAPKFYLGSFETLAFRPDGKLLASRCHGKMLWILGTAIDAGQRMLAGHSDYVTAVSFSPDGTLVASGSHDKTVRIWDTASTAPTKRLNLRGSLDALRRMESPLYWALHADGYRKTIWFLHFILDIKQQQRTGFRHEARVFVFSPDDRLVASTLNDNQIHLWDTATGTKRCTLKGHSRFVTAIGFSPDSRLVATCSDDTTARLWSIATGVEKFSLKGHSAGVVALVFSPDGRLLATGSSDQTIRVWDTETGTVRLVLSGFSEWVASLRFSPDGKLLAAGFLSDPVRLWDTATGRERHTIPSSSDGRMAFSPGSRLLAILELSSIRLCGTLPQSTQDGTTSDETTEVIERRSQTGSLSLTETQDRDIRASEVQGILKGHSGNVKHAAFSPDGKWLASSDDKTVRLWDVATCSALGVTTTDTPLQHLSFSSCGTYLITDCGILLLRLLPDTGRFSPRVFASGTWVRENEEEILFIPPDYREALLFVNGSTMVFTDVSHRGSILQLSSSAKCMTGGALATS
ncbi:WD-repeat protein [Penicillium alfredii]|uniref:Mitochondrial division protein 1 n=1 Tax=Penicillium alfredii TaxID=1506179 RepID=A0A9W9F072_9EURO|nr:WD-repeat protein [Penicillium alfredii]KAJ5091223.1 WD-repeat protein [Penicillium alfredii]